MKFIYVTLIKMPKKILKFKIKFKNYFFNINEIKKYEFDLVIFATTADKRFKLLKIFLNFNICKYIILKKLYLIIIVK